MEGYFIGNLSAKMYFVDFLSPVFSSKFLLTKSAKSYLAVRSATLKRV